jgi:SPP1 family predicted phage head-tail adaptor
VTLSHKLNRLVTVQYLEAGQDQAGQPVDTWAEFATVWASIEDLTGREFQAAQATQNGTSTRIRIRYREGIEAQMRVVQGAHVYDIQAVLDRDGRKTELQLMCRRGVSNG